MTAEPATLDALLGEIRACRFCEQSPLRRPLPHAPRPVLLASATARIGVFSQAPGTRVHASGMPFTDPSGDRLRGWMGVDKAEFYDTARIAIVPMGFCFPGLDATGADLPPRQECAPRWRQRVLDHLRDLQLVLLIGHYAMRWHIEPGLRAGGVNATVLRWREIWDRPARPRLLPMPHPSWRNSGWLKRNPWFETELVPLLQAEVRRQLDPERR